MRPALSRATKIALLIIPINTVVWGITFSQRARDVQFLILFTGMAVAQLVYGILAIVAGVRRRRAREGGAADLGLGVLATLGALVGWFVGVGVIALSSIGPGGRPLRVRGRQRVPSLRDGEDWTAGPRPDAADLDAATRRALEALWLRDAQAEHASVPAFSRLSWLLAAAGGPAELLIGCHRAATEEIEHARACFALAAGYGGRSFTVEPMPELLCGGAFDGDGTDPRVTLAVESLADGCQLEDFNADIAAACAAGCEEPVTRAVLERIAIEERSHAELSWSILGWLVARHRATVEAPLHHALAALDHYCRPTAVSNDKRAIVALADPAQLRRHGRLADERWAAAWTARLEATRARYAALLAVPHRRAA